MKKNRSDKAFEDRVEKLNRKREVGTTHGIKVSTSVGVCCVVNRDLNSFLIEVIIRYSHI